MNKQWIEALIEEQRIEQETYKTFINQKLYLNTLDGLIGKQCDSDDRKEWTEEMDLLFSFIYPNANALRINQEQEEAVVKYNNHFFEFFEMQGQGTYRSIYCLEEIPELNNVVKLEDIEEYSLTGKKPIKIATYEIVVEQLKIMEKYFNGIGMPLQVGEVLDYSIEETIAYLQANLS